MQSIYTGKLHVIKALREVPITWVDESGNAVRNHRAYISLADCEDFVNTLPLSFESDKMATDHSIHDWILVNEHDKAVETYTARDQYGARGSTVEYAEHHKGTFRLCRIVADVYTNVDIEERS